MPNKLNITGIVNGAQKALEAVRDMAPVVEKLGGPSVASVATIGIAAIAIIENVLERGKDASVAMTTQDEGKLRAMLSELQEANDKLAGVIASE